jgi:hypothetical protein
VTTLEERIAAASVSMRDAKNPAEEAAAETALAELLAEKDTAKYGPPPQGTARTLLTFAGTWEPPVPFGAAGAESWPALRPEARIGLTGEVIGALLPHTEADEAGLVLDFLAAFGANVGPGSYTVADAARHPARLFVCLAGKTSRGRKGTVRNNINRIFEVADPDFCQFRILSGLSTGEGLINAVSDGTKDRSGNLVGVVEDKRLLIFEPEFSRVLKVAARESATLSAILRDAWDRGNLRVITRKDPLSATGAHVVVMAHVTAEELRRNLTETEIANGLANRFLFAMVRRSKRLPHGTGLADAAVRSLGLKVRGALQRARTLGRLERTVEANDLWEGIYAAIEDDREGLYGAVTARAEAQILRLSLTYALIDGSPSIGREHLLAGLAVWEYADESARVLFGNAFGDEVSERLYRAVEAAGEDGLDAQDQMEVFGRHIGAGRLNAARAYLERRRCIRTVSVKTKGRPRMVSVKVRGAQPDQPGAHLFSAFFAPVPERGGGGRGAPAGKGAKKAEGRSDHGEGENRNSLSSPLPEVSKEAQVLDADGFTPDASEEDRALLREVR